MTVREPEIESSGEAVAPSGAVAPSDNRVAGLSLTSNFVWTFVGNVLYAGCQWAVVVVLAKLASAEVVGQYALGLAVGYPITFIANLQLRTLFVTDLAGRYPFFEILGLRYILSAVSMAVVAITCAVSRYDPFTAGVILVVALAQIVDCISENYYGVMQREERLDRISVSLVLRSMLGSGFLIAGVYFTHNLLWGVTGLVLGRAIVLACYEARFGVCPTTAREPYVVRFRPQWNLPRQLKMVWIALPLGIVSILVAINGNAPRYVIEHALGRHQLGIYSAISYVPSGCFMIATALGYAVFARLAKLFFNGDVTQFKIILFKTGAICAGLGAAGFLGSALLGRIGLTILYRPEYAQHVDLLRWLMIVGAVQCLNTTLGCALTAASQFRVQVPIFVVVTASSLLSCALLIPRMGLLGAAMGVLVSTVVQLVLTAIAMHRAMVRRTRAGNASGTEVLTNLEPALEFQD
jgi:O-antigen/teichoic acid export membrane protein